ncbi:MAG TPA: cytochrome c3 family protein [Tepidisphaeraceae bacterium]|nr:cytochrome c3 family protein [Tepidisphaeraceae bacterium]
MRKIRTHFTWALLISGLLFAFSATAMAQKTSIINSPHNLSAAGPGAIRATTEQEICIFCHTPHNSSPIQPLWNRNVPTSAYTVYSSNSLQARPGQPTGSSKLCLSCHDGTIAVGSVLSRQQPIAMAGGMTTLPPGHSNLGTDLSDDHPISFRYDAALSVQDPKLKPPSILPASIKLDANQELQCTSCHDAHNDENGAFLVMDNSRSQLCSSCHQPGNTTIVQHEQCATCHQMHTAPSAALLLKGVNSSQTCLTCHSSTPSATPGQDISADLNKFTRHDVPVVAPMMPLSETASQTSAACGDCHEPHSMQSGTASAPLKSPKLGQVSGVNAAGAAIPAAQFEFEVCFKCHTTEVAGSNPIPRKIVQTNTRLEFAPSAVSFHPVEVAGKNSDVPSLRVGLTNASVIYCTDCHSSDTSKVAGASGPNGPHGSNVPFLLSGRYETTDNSAESTAAYDLCYRCHDRASILGDQSFSSHSKHIVDLKTPCSVCHDAHGVSSAQGNSVNNSHLINFDTRVVQPDTVTGLMEYRLLGPRTGQCSLTCHGAAHSPLAYPTGVEPGGAAPAGIRSAVRRPAARPTVRPGSK